MGKLKQFLDCQIAIRRVEERRNIYEKQYLQYGSLNVPPHIFSSLDEATKEIYTYQEKLSIHRKEFTEIVHNYISKIRSIETNFDKYNIIINDKIVTINNVLELIINNKQQSFGFSIAEDVIRDDIQFQETLANYISYKIKNLYNDIIPIYVNLHNKNILDTESFLKTYIRKEVKLEADDIPILLTGLYNKYNDLNIIFDIYFIFIELDQIKSEKSITHLVEYLNNNSIPYIVIFEEKLPTKSKIVWRNFIIEKNELYIEKEDTHSSGLGSDEDDSF